eukprot:scaffold76989_cov102-Phaeocystis_antarctica.AAC.4
MRERATGARGAKQVRARGCFWGAQTAQRPVLETAPFLSIYLSVLACCLTISNLRPPLPPRLSAWKPVRTEDRISGAADNFF